MKFGHTLAIEASELPKPYQSHILAYKDLKKLVKQIVIDMRNHGLHPDQIHPWLFPLNTTSSCSFSKNETTCTFDTTCLSTLYSCQSSMESLTNEPTFAPKISYVLSPSSSQICLPSPTTTHPSISSSLESESFSDILQNLDSQIIIQLDTSMTTTNSFPESEQKEYPPLIIPLNSDTYFFSYLSTALSDVYDLQKKYVSDYLTTRLPSLVHLLECITRKNSPDRSIWKHLLHLYFHTDIFLYSDLSTPKDYITSTQLLTQFEQQMHHFLHLVEPTPKLFLTKPKKKRKNPTPYLKFMQHHSHTFLTLFHQWNHDLLHLHKYLELTTTAVKKILKKHDKKTKLPSLAILNLFPWQRSLNHVHFTFVRHFQTTLESITPLLHHHLCPICYELVYPPLKLKCGHVFCTSCIYFSCLHTFFASFQRPFPLHLLFLGQLTPEMEWSCALCRSPSGITSSHFLQDLDTFTDQSLLHYLQLHFKDEMKIKKKDWKQNLLIRDQSWMNWILLQGLR